MSLRIRTFMNNRQLVAGSVDELIATFGLGQFVAILPGQVAEANGTIPSVVERLLALGCKEFCSIGPDADQLHDALDAVIERKSAPDVLSTAFKDASDAFEYLMFGADAGNASFFIPDLPGSRDIEVWLESKIRESVGNDGTQM